MWMMVCRGMRPSGIAATSALMPKYAKKQPTAAPARASTKLSTSSWRTRRDRLAPSEARIAISRSRAVARVSSMFATLLHAINSRSPTAAARV